MSEKEDEELIKMFKNLKHNLNMFGFEDDPENLKDILEDEFVHLFLEHPFVKEHLLKTGYVASKQKDIDNEKIKMRNILDRIVSYINYHIDKKECLIPAFYESLQKIIAQLNDIRKKYLK